MNSMCQPQSAIFENLLPRSVQYMKRRFKSYLARRMDREAFRHLSQLDDSLLDDIGVTRADVEWAMNLPPSQDAAIALQLLSRGYVKRL